MFDFPLMARGESGVAVLEAALFRRRRLAELGCLRHMRRNTSVSHRVVEYGERHVVV